MLLNIYLNYVSPFPPLFSFPLPSSLTPTLSLSHSLKHSHPGFTIVFGLPRTRNRLLFSTGPIKRYISSRRTVSVTFSYRIAPGRVRKTIRCEKSMRINLVTWEESIFQVACRGSCSGVCFSVVFFFRGVMGGKEIWSRRGIDLVLPEFRKWRKCIQRPTYVCV